MYIHRERRVLKLIKYNIMFTHIKSDINNTRNYYTLYTERDFALFRTFALAYTFRSANGSLNIRNNSNPRDITIIVGTQNI